MDLQDWLHFSLPITLLPDFGEVLFLCFLISFTFFEYEYNYDTLKTMYDLGVGEDFMSFLAL